MTRRGRLALFVVAALALGPLLLVGMGGLARFGEFAGAYGERLNHLSVPLRRATNVVTAINFDFRGFDTLGEEFILFAAVAGVALLLRERRGESAAAPPAGEPDRVWQKRSEAVRLVGIGMIGAVNLFGVYLVVHAASTPGGGFQGGAILGTGSLLAYLVGRYESYRRVVSKPWVDLAEALGAGAYALIGVATVVAGGAFLENLLPPGEAGTLLSGGTIGLINLAVGLEVAAGFALLFLEFLEETRQPAEGDDG